MALDLVANSLDDDEDYLPPNKLQPYFELPAYGVPPPDRKWLIDQIVAELDRGQFSNAGYLGDAILRDARVMGAMEQRMSGLFSKPLRLEPADDSALATRIRDEVMDSWEVMFPRPALEEQQQYGILQGVAIVEKVWDTSTTPWTFTIKPWRPVHYTWRWDLGAYTLVTRDRGLIRIPQRSAQWMTYTPYGYARAFLRGRLRALIDPWLYRGWCKNDWAHWCEIHGTPIRMAIVPQQADPKQETDFVKQLANLGSNTVVKARQDRDGNKFAVELIEASGDGWKGFEAQLAWCDKEIATVLLGQSHSIDGVGGLSSQEKPGEAVRLDVNRTDSEKLCEALYTQCLRDYCEYNYGNPDLAPRPLYEVDPPEDDARVAECDAKTAQALVSFKAAGAPIDVRGLLEERGYPLLTPAEEAAQKAAQPDMEAQLKQAQLEGEQAKTDWHRVDAGVLSPEEVRERMDVKPKPKKPTAKRARKKP